MRTQQELHALCLILRKGKRDQSIKEHAWMPEYWQQWLTVLKPALQSNAPKMIAVGDDRTPKQFARDITRYLHTDLEEQRLVINNLYQSFGCKKPYE